MTRTFVTNMIVALLALPLLAAAAAASPQEQAVFTSFEEFDPNTIEGEPIVIGTFPDSAVLSGDAWAGATGNFDLYYSGLRSWMVVARGIGVMTFETDAEVVEFWARVLALARRGTIITAFDEFGEIVGVPVTVSPGTGWQPIYFSGRIAWIEVDNLDTQEMNAIDDFGFTSLPEPGAALTLVSGFGMLLAMAKLRAIPVLH